MVPENLREEWEERAAIMEFDGGMTRARAEKMAAERILRREGLLEPEQAEMFDNKERG